MLHKAIFLIFLLSTQNALAHPVSFKNGFGVMPEYTSQRQDLELNYSITSNYALGISAVRSDYHDDEIKFIIPRFNYKLYRNNADNSQTNLYASLGAGAARYQDRDLYAGLASFQADFETRRIYNLLSAESLFTESGESLNKFRYRFGVAPYITDFDSLHTWIIAQIDYNPEIENEATLSPVLRFFYQNYLVEVGVSTNGDIFTAGIFHF